ncbi:MAG: hypothetical protein WC325_12055 [Candidatus Bathyarchaeia archaeon]|jgi:hypothetical protein
MAKTKNSTLAIGLALILLFSFVAYQAGWLGDIFGSGANPIIPDNGGSGQVANPTDQVSVNKPLKIVGVDELAGGALDGTTSAITIYDSDGKTVLETGTFSSGTLTTGVSYQSGKVLWIKYYYDTTIDSYMFWQYTVPKMTQADAESLTTNQITLKTREAGAYTDSLQTSTGTTITDGLDFNTTGSANDTGTMTYTFFTTTDNTGYPQFKDPIYNLDMKAVLWAEISGTGYSSISLTGFDGSFEQGSTMKYYKYIPVNDIAKYKVGNDYVYNGAGSHSFGWNAAGFSNSTTSYPTLQLTLKIYSNDAYMRQMGDYGPYDFSACEQTVDFMDI